MKARNEYVIGFQDIDKTQIAIAGGKGANLGELARINGLQVPDGFCITTRAYKMIFGENEILRLLLDKLAGLKADNRKEISETAVQIRRAIEKTPIPESIKDEVVRCMEQLGVNQAYAVRSSATAEDLLTATFAGQ